MYDMGGIIFPRNLLSTLIPHSVDNDFAETQKKVGTNYVRKWGKPFLRDFLQEARRG